MILNPILNTLSDIAVGAMEADTQKARIRADRATRIEELQVERQRLELLDVHLRDHLGRTHEELRAELVSGAHELVRAGEDCSRIVRELCDPDLSPERAARLEAVLVVSHDHVMNVSRSMSSVTDKSAVLATRSVLALPSGEPRRLALVEEG